MDTRENPYLAVHCGRRVFGMTTPIECISTGQGAIESNLHLGEDDGGMVGWCSRAENEISPSYALNFANNEIKSRFFVTHLTSSKKFEHISTAVNISGRSMKLMWQDDNGKYSLILKRPENGQISLIHKVI
jgi:hypothetical protein